MYDGSHVTFGDFTADGFATDNFALGDVNSSDTWKALHPQYEAYNSVGDGRGYFKIWDAAHSEYVSYQGLDANDTTCTIDTDGSDKVFKCDAEELIPGVFVHPEVRYFAETGVQRLVWVIDNQTGAEFAADVIVSDYSECDGTGYAFVSDGTEGGSNVDASASNWMVQRPADNNHQACGIEVSVWQANVATVKGTADLSSNLDGNEINYVWNIPATKTNALAFFYLEWLIDDQNNDNGTAFLDSRDYQFGFASQAATDSSFREWADRWGVGLTADKKIDMVNWNASYGADPALAETGVDGSGIAIAGFGLLVAGVVVAIRRRARA